MRTLLAALVWLSACTATPLPDGSTCAGNEACASGLCDLSQRSGRDGVCLGRACADDAGCDEGYRCHTVSGTPGTGASSRCVATCGRCPPYHACPAGGVDGETFCAAAP